MGRSAVFGPAVYDAFRMSHEIEGSAAGAQTFYQMQITVFYEDTPPTSLSERAGNPIADVPRAGWATTTIDAQAFLRIDADVIYLFVEGFPNGVGETLGRLESNDDGETWAWSTNGDPLADFANVGQVWSGRGDEACPAPVVVNGTKYLFYSSRPVVGGAYGFWSMGVATTDNWETFSPINAINPILSLGGGGEWDESCVFHTSKPILIDGTWYIFYTGRRALDGLSQIGLATTSEANFPDNWTKHGGNPFFTGSRPKIILVGSTYYMYYTGLDTTLKRRTSPDLINWTAEVSINSDIIEADVISAGNDYIFAGLSNIWDGNLEVGIWVRDPSEVSLIEHCRTDFGDVRFRQGETELDYWIDDKVDGDYAVFFVEVPTIPAAPDVATIHIYYGKADATTTSSGADTFPDLFEDFEDGTIGNPPAGWTNDTGFFSVEEDFAYHGDKSLRVYPPVATWKHLDKVIAKTGKFILEYAMRRDTISETQILIVYDGATQTSWLAFAKSAGLDRLYYNDGAYVLILVYVADRWYKIRQVMDIDADTYDIYVDDVLEVSDADFKNVVASLDSVQLWSYDQVYGWYDRILIRKYVSPEPAHSDWGAEEAVSWPF